MPITLAPARGERQAAEGHVTVPLAGLMAGDWVLDVIARTPANQHATRALVLRVK
jgi:hypothetical protein